MKVLIYGRGERMHRVARLLEALKMEATVTASQAECLDNASGMDLVLVDLGHENAPAFCRHLRTQVTAPVIGLVNPLRAEWSELGEVPILGYVPLSLNEHELAARLKAMTRWVVAA